MSNIIEIQISNYEVPKHRQWDILVGLYKTILHKDKNWHFFYEIFYNIIRCSARYRKSVCKFLDENNVKWECKGRWVDNQEITKKHQKHFQSIFHANCEMIMSMALAEDQTKTWSEIYLIADRLVHCFLINCDYIADRWKIAAQRCTSWESYLTSQIASDRGLYSGQCAKTYDENNVSMAGYENDYTWAYHRASLTNGKIK